MVEEGVVILESLQEAWLGGSSHGEGHLKEQTVEVDDQSATPGQWGSKVMHYLVNFPHYVFEGLVDSEKHFRLSWQLPLDVGSREDGLQVEPVPLAGQPLVLQRVHLS